MADNLKILRPEDPRKININQPWEVQYWSNELGCTQSKLRMAVSAVGPMVEDVRKWLRLH